MSTVAVSHARLPVWAPVLVLVMAFAAAGLPAMLLSWGITAWVCLGLLLFLVGLPAWSLVVENRRSAVDRLMTGLVWTAFAGRRRAVAVADLRGDHQRPAGDQRRTSSPTPCVA